MWIKELYEDTRPKEYTCKECEYQWISRKDFGKPCKCPSCNSKNIKNEVELKK